MEEVILKSVAVFNNKGGVGKTTISTNLGYELARSGNRVLVMDLDPQSNTTQVVLNQDQVERLYTKSLGDIARIWSVKDIYTPMLDSNEATIGDVKSAVLKGKKHRFLFDVIPSSLMLSEFEDTLSDAWSDLRANKLGGLRRTNWFIQLTEQIKDDYDYLILDLSPSLGALNRSVLLNVDSFIIPVTGDIYNVYGIKNISTWIRGWIKIYTRAMGYLEEDYSSDIIDDAKINRTIAQGDFKKFAGFIISKARTSGKGHDRKVISYQNNNLNNIKDVITDTLLFAATEPNVSKLELGTVLEIRAFLTDAEGAHEPAYRAVVDSIAFSDPYEKSFSDDGGMSAKFGMMKSFEEIATNLKNNLGVRE